MMHKPLYSIPLVFVALGVMATVFSRSSSDSKILFVVLFYAVFVAGIFMNKHYVKSLGLDRDTVRAGIRLATPFVVLITASTMLAATIIPSIFQDPRYDLSGSAVVLTIFIIIPFMTVFVEELLFRGLLLGELLRIATPFRANLISSIGFGIWHIFTARSITLPVDLAQPVIIIGVIIVTALAGLFFGWLRLRSKSLIAPVLVHWAINSSGVLAAFIAWN